MQRKMTLTIVGGGYVVRNLVSGLAALAGKKDVWWSETYWGIWWAGRVFPHICMYSQIWHPALTWIRGRSAVLLRLFRLVQISISSYLPLIVCIWQDIGRFFPVNLIYLEIMKRNGHLYTFKSKAHKGKIGGIVLKNNDSQKVFTAFRGWKYFLRFIREYFRLQGRS